MANYSEHLIGRKEEIATLSKAIASKRSEFIALYGRRRVGKTFLVREFFQNQFAFQLTGLANASTSQQLTNFLVAIQRYAKGNTSVAPNNWLEAFQLLIEHLESISIDSKKIVFLDELPWLDTPRSDFMMALEHFWNSWASARKDIVLVTCGSAAAWMINELISNHGGLHNRVTIRMRIKPFNLRETEALLKANGCSLDRYQILQLYMVMGGIPYYLDAVEPDKSASQNIDYLCFREGALLNTEFRNLFLSLFKNPNLHEQLIEALAEKPKGMSRKELIKVLKISSGGGLSGALNELEESGFIIVYNTFGKKNRDALYRLSDFYCIFYLKFIKNHHEYDEDYWVKSLDHPRQRTWMGLAFEQVCLAHIPVIKRSLGISGVLTRASAWRSKRLEGGAQVDLVIDRRDQTINLCEIKFSINPYVITGSYADQLRNKIAVFRQETKTKKALFLTMITTYGVKKNLHSGAIVQNEVVMDDLFLF